MKAIAKRQGRPAYESAPPRLRQSHIAQPHRLLDAALIERPNVLARLIAKVMK